MRSWRFYLCPASKVRINALLKLLGDRDEAMAKWLESVFNVVLSAEVTEQLEAESYSQISGGDLFDPSVQPL